MTITAGQLAALDYLEGLPASKRPRTIVFPNMSKKAVVPRWEIFEGPVDQNVALLNGDIQASLLLQIDVVVKDGIGSKTMRTQVQKVLNAFPVLQTFGAAKVLQPPTVGGYRKDGTEYKASITVPYELL